MKKLSFTNLSATTATVLALASIIAPPAFAQNYHRHHSNRIDGVCGSSERQALSAAPSTDLCTAGTASDVTTTHRHYRWRCEGVDGGRTASCSATISTPSTATPVDGTCGSANGQTLNAAPTTNLCGTGTASTVTGTGPWAWSCAGTGGGTTVQCQAALQAATTNAACGTHSSGSTYTLTISSTNNTVAATTAQCPNGGTVPTLTVVTQTYVCTNGAQNASGAPVSKTTTATPVCSTAPASGAACDAHPSGSTYTLTTSSTTGSTAATTAQCPNGGTVPTTTTTTQTYTCTNGTQTASGAPVTTTTSGTPACTAATEAACGSSNDVTLSSIPKTGLCNVGTASAVTDNGAGSWVWACTESGGVSAACYALQGATSTPVNGQCGATVGTCSAGTATGISGSTWICAGTGSGSSESCPVSSSSGVISTPIAGGLDLTGYHLTFDDEFNSFTSWSAAGSTKWQTTMFEGSRNYDGTYLSDANVGFDPFSDDGKVLTIVATPGTTPSGAPYFGGVISSAGSFSQAFGYFEMRAQLPVGAGLWPAFWMYPETGYGIRELDVLEAFGAPYQGQGSLTEYHAAMHDSSLPNTQAGGWVSTVPSGTNITEGFHTYGMLWTPTTTTYYFDGQQTEQLPTPADMTVPMYMMANNAVGGAGTWPGPTAGETGAMYVDYIRVFSNDASAPAVTMEPLSSPDGGGNNLYGATLPN